MKKYSALLLFVILFTVFSAKAQSRWVEDSQMKFKISIPANYQTNQFWDGSDKIHAFVSPDQNVAVRVRSIPVPANATVDLIVQAFSQNIIKGAQQLVNQAHTLNGLSGKLAAYKWKYNNINVVIGAFYTIENGIAYVVWTMVPENLLGKRSAESDAITNSFTVLADNAQTSTSTQTGGLGSLGEISNSQTTADIPVNIRITDLSIGTEATADAQIPNPQSTIDPLTEKVHLVFGYSGNAKGKTFIVKWFNETTNASLGDSPYFPADAPSGRGYASLNNPGNLWPEGRYRAEVWLNDQMQDQAWFDVASTGYSDFSNTSDIVSSVPDGYFELVSDDACIEHLAPSGYQVTGSKPGQSIWGDGSGLNMVQQVIIKQTGFDTFMSEHLDEIKNKGAEIIGSSSMDVNGLPVYQYLYKYGNSIFVYLSTENNNVFYLLGFAGNVSNEERAIVFSNTIINSFKKADCPF
ncbi:MAG: hypothetical protein RBS73_06770 [Prolixibacteraceae bacterium]|jgi:hypothetical protein|nr:hypothetical protein [Prolixibacteraceae bacterium]